MAVECQRSRSQKAVEVVTRLDARVPKFIYLVECNSRISRWIFVILLRLRKQEVTLDRIVIKFTTFP